jgi:hypothetical protein
MAPAATLRGDATDIGDHAKDFRISAFCCSISDACAMALHNSRFLKRQFSCKNEMVLRGRHMDTISPVISLTDDHDMRPIKLLSHWDVDGRNRTVFHRPSKLVFLIDYVQALNGERLRPSAVTARAAHVCDGRQLPAVKTLRRIGKDAIHAFILCSDVCSDPLDQEDIPF